MTDLEFDTAIRRGIYARTGGALLQYGTIIGFVIAYQNDRPEFIFGGAVLYLFGELAKIAGDGITTGAIVEKRLKESSLEKKSN